MKSEKNMPIEEKEAPTAKTIALTELHASSEETAGGLAVLNDISPLHQIKARLQVCIGEASITVGELLNAKEHQVLKLDRTLEQPVDLLLEGKVVAHGMLMAVDEHFAVRITELPVSLKLMA